jgi:hypothetical protein
MHSLTKDEKNKARVCFAVLITALVMQRVNQQVGITGEQPAIQQCTALIDDIVNPMTGERRQLVVHRIQRQRIRFAVKVEKTDSASALIGAIDVLTSDTFKSKLGTRFDFIRQTLRQNVEMTRRALPHSEETVRRFMAEFRKAILDV